MNRIFFWISFVALIALIIWGLIVASKKDLSVNKGQPAPVTTLDHTIGKEDAPVTIIEYSDFQCPACQMYYYVVEELISNSSSTVRFVYRHFPLPQHGNAISASLASEAAGVQGKFWDMYKLIFDKHTDWTELADPKPIFIGYANDLGLDIEKFKQDYASSTLRKKIENSIKEGNSIGVDSTPTFFLNGKVINNPTSYDQFKKLIEEASKSGF